ncbi:MAG: urease accessory protein UreF [Deltaproteobacteria bacterium]|nr:urease accessory protein UreF [Deltaproteobacteria bacterium]
MTNPPEILTLLQHGDSFFPSGAFASSWGLETLHADGKVTDAVSLTRFIAGQLRLRWARCDRVALISTYRAGDALAQVAQIDAELEALALARDLREASRRAGRALLRTHAQLATRNAATYLEWIKTGQAYGHVPVAQGVVWRGVGLSEEAATMLSGHGLCLTFVSVAIRLGIISHIEAQQILGQLHAPLLEILHLPPPPFMSSFSPLTDVAIMRHETQSVRLFAS